ncbi:MAG: acyl carrier protein [Saprospiraceae bacterium]
MNKTTFLERFKNQIEDFEKGESIEMKTEFRKLKYWDSLTALMVISMIDDDYNISINGDDLNTLNTIQELFDFIISNQQPK